MANKKKRKSSALEPPAKDALPPAKRGRPATAKPDEVIAAPALAPTATPSKRGRNTKAQGDELASPPGNEVAEASTTPSRSKKVKPNTTATRASKRLSDGAAEAAAANLGPRLRRSSARGAENGTSNGSVVAVKRAKSKANGKSKAATKATTAVSAEETPVSLTSKNPEAKRSSKRNKSAKNHVENDDQMAKNSNISVKVASSKEETSEDEDADDEAEDGPNYWLMKAEPESRIEKGKDVKFSIDDLRAVTEPEGWDGVRNATARNNMRMMFKGDLAFFYHSNCKTPGIAGVMEIVQEHSPDESALDSKHPYYDEKSTAENPKWCKVHVAFRQKFPKLIKLRELQRYAKDGGILENMQTLRQSRLSVSKVTQKQWNFIMSLVDDDEENPTPPAPRANMAAGGGATNGNLTRASLWTEIDSPEKNDTPADENFRMTENHPGTSILDTDMSTNRGDAAVPSSARPDQKMVNGNPEINGLGVNTASKIDYQPTHRVQGTAEHLSGLANPLEDVHDNAVEDFLATMVPNSSAPS